jgi:Ca2+-binding EF-hand superfamily protein
MAMVMEAFNYVKSYFEDRSSADISEEKIEEYKMSSGFSQKEIVRLRKVFLRITNDSETMTKSMFENIETLKLNPLKDRICVCFELVDEGSTINFENFLLGVSNFNAPGRGEVKMKTAFKIQDFDGDGTISKGDLTEYLTRITAGNLKPSEVEEVINEIFKETSSDSKQESLSFSDFQRVAVTLDFQAKVHLPI